MKQGVLALSLVLAFQSTTAGEVNTTYLPVKGSLRTYHCRSAGSSKPFELCGSTTIVIQGLRVHGLGNDTNGTALISKNVSCLAVLPYNEMYFHVKGGETVSINWQLDDYDFFFSKAGFHLAMDEGEKNDDAETRDILGKVSVSKVPGMDSDRHDRAASVQSAVSAPSASINHLPIVRFVTKRDTKGMVVESIRCAGVDPVMINSSE